MNFEQIYSGSDGNLYVLKNSEGQKLMIECGVSWKKLLKGIDYDLSGFVGCVVTHGHADHSVSMVDVMRSGIKVYATEGTFVERKDDGVFSMRRNMELIEDGGCVEVEDSFRVNVFKMMHDSLEPVGFVISDLKSDERMLFAIDTKTLEWDFNDISFDIIGLECSYDEELLELGYKKGNLNEVVAKRLIRSHSSKKSVIQFLDNYCDLSRCRELHLLHISHNYNVKQKLKEEFEKRYFVEVKVI